MSAVAVLAGVLVGAGIFVVAVAFAGRLPQVGELSTPRRGLWTRAVDNLRAVRRRTWWELGAGLCIGVLLAYVMRSPVLFVAAPLATVGMPRLLGEPTQSEVELLEALDRWVRGIVATLATGRSITEAVRISARQPPSLLANAISALVKRLEGRWPLDAALWAMADDLDSPDADAVLAALILSASRGGTGAASTLDALAESIQQRLRALREIEAERAKPRIVVRQVTLISALALVACMVASPAFFEPYASPLGQVVLASLLAVYVLAIWLMRRMTLPRRRQRILRGAP